MKTTTPLHNPHPGETLKEALEDYGISQYRLGQDLGIPHSRVTAIIKGRQGITANTALRLGKYFSTPPEYWLNLQHMHDLAAAIEGQHEALERIQPLPAAWKLETSYSGMARTAAGSSHPPPPTPRPKPHLASPWPRKIQV